MHMNIGLFATPPLAEAVYWPRNFGKALADKGHNIHFITYQQPVRLSGFHANIFYHEVRVPTYPCSITRRMKRHWPVPWWM